MGHPGRGGGPGAGAGLAHRARQQLRRPRFADRGDRGQPGRRLGWRAGHQLRHARLPAALGRAWTRASLPPAIRRIKLAEVSDLAASSASNVWAFISGHPAAAARFDGTAWRVVREWPGEAFSITGEAFSARDVWMFGGIGPRTAGTWHYDGRSWTRPKMPLTAFDVSRVSAKDEWAIEN